MQLHFSHTIQSVAHYIVNKMPIELSPNMAFCEECEDENGEEVDLLFIKISDGNKRKVQRLIDHEIKPLCNKDIPGFIKTIYADYDEQHSVYYIVYEHSVLLDNLSETSLGITDVIQIAEGLNHFKKSNNSHTFLIAPSYMAVGQDEKVKLRFARLFSIFAEEQLLEDKYLSPELRDYLKDKLIKPAPQIQSDIYSLIMAFQPFLDKYQGTKYQSLIQEIITKGLQEDRRKRFSKYSELIDLLQQLPSLHSDSPIIQVVTNPEYEKDFEPIIRSMNYRTWMWVEPKRSKAKREITGLFTTDAYCGRFFVNEEGYIFIPYTACNQEKDERLVQREDAFLAKFQFSLEECEDTYNCSIFFKEKFEQINHLAALHTTRNNELTTWQKLPEAEKEFVEANAFKVFYDKRELSSDDNRIVFTLSENTKSWGEIKEIKNNHKLLFVDDVLVGEILDWRSMDKTITIKSPKCTIDELPEKGELVEDIRQETSQFKKQIEACQKYLKGNVVNKSLGDIIATPTTDIPCKVHDLKYEEFGDRLFNPALQNDASQMEAVLEAITHKPLYLIQGPPGAGKTTVIVEIIRQLVSRQKDVKILLTSQSNLAVDNVLEKLLAVADISFMRLASDNAMENDTVSECMKQHCYEEKLKQWVSNTEKAATDYFNRRFPLQEKGLCRLGQVFAEAQADNDFMRFEAALKFSPGYIKSLFAKTTNIHQVKEVFESKLGKDYFLLKRLQKDWFSFIGNVLVDADADGKRKKAMLNDGSLEIDFLTAMLMKTNVVGATCIHIASGKYNQVNFAFDYVIMDESSKATPAESLVPLSMGQNIIMIGDDNQLPPVITREEAVKQDIKNKLEDNGLDIEKTYGVSLFEKIKRQFQDSDNNARYVKMLNIQYRMPKQLGSLISEFFYDGKLKNPDIPDYDEQKSHELCLKADTSIVFLSTSTQSNPWDNGDKFKRQNRCNVNVIRELLNRLNKLYAGNLEREKPLSIGIIAGYRGQVELLKQCIDLKKYHNFRLPDNTSLIEINTVDRFQGAERDIIIYDVVRSSQGHDNIGFLADYRRINVAFSRAKRLLFVVGDSDYLLKRAKFTPTEEFPEFKLQKITQKLQSEGLVFNNLNDIFCGS